MYPLRRKPTKLFSKIIILIIWVLGLAFAVPMGIVYTFEYVPVNEEEKELKPFCHLNFGPNATNSTELLMFQYYRYVDFSLFFVVSNSERKKIKTFTFNNFINAEYDNSKLFPYVFLHVLLLFGRFVNNFYDNTYS